jgi:hypothetical protein
MAFENYLPKFNQDTGGYAPPVEYLDGVNIGYQDYPEPIGPNRMTMDDAVRMSKDKYSRERSLEEQAYIDSQIAADQDAARKEQNRLDILKANAAYTPERIDASLKAGEAVAAGRVAARQQAKWDAEDKITPPKVVPVPGAKRWKVANTPQGKYDPKSEAASYVLEDQIGYPPVVQQVSNKPRTWKDEYDETANAGDKYEIKRQFFDMRRQQILKEIYQRAENLPLDQQDHFVRMNLGKLDVNMPAMANIRSGEAFKSAQQEATRAGRLQNEYTLSVLHNELALAKDALRRGDQKGLITFLQTNIPKVLQSLATGQSDAIQDSEARRLLPELKTIAEIPPWQWAEFVKNRGSMTEIFGTDIEGFIAKAERVYAAGASALNSKYDQYNSVLGEAVKDSGMQRFKTEVGGNLGLKKTPADYQRILKDQGLKPIELNPYETPTFKATQQGQSANPSQPNTSNLKLGKVVSGGSFGTVPIIPQQKQGDGF